MAIDENRSWLMGKHSGRRKLREHDDDDYVTKFQALINGTNGICLDYRIYSDN